MTMRATTVAAVLVGSFLGCSSGGSPTPTAPPTLTITSPARGTVANSTTVMVTGTAQGVGKLDVTVNGGAVDLQPDGSFTTTLSIDPGIGIIETHARDKSGNDVRDVRAVLAGTTATSDGSITSPLGARVGTDGVTAIGNAIASDAQNIDFTAVAQGLNPIYNNGGCLGARVDITSVSVGAINVGLAPDTTIGTTVTIDDVTVKLHASFKVACLGGSTTITVHSSRAHITGDLGATVSGTAIKTSLANPSVVLDNFTVDVGGVPSAISGLLDSQARSGAQNAITSAIRDKVPPLADKALAGLVAKPISAAILGKDAQIDLAPSRIVLNTDGVFIQVDASVKVAGGEGGRYLANPSPLTLAVMPDTTGLGLAIADDVANQLFAGLWAAGAFDRQIAIGDGSPLGILLDPSVKTLDIKLSLPPTLTTQGAAVLAVGDLIATGRDAAGTDVQTIALSLSTSIAAMPGQSNKLTLSLGAPEVHAQVLQQSDSVTVPLDDQRIEGLVEGVWGLVGGAASDALAKVPMPSFGGLTLGEPTIDGHSGFVRAKAAL